MFWTKKKAITETYSQYGIPGHLFSTKEFRLKIIIDPPKEYFSGKLTKDQKNFDKLLLIHGCETPDINDISKQVLQYTPVFTKVLSFDPEVVVKHSNAELFCFGSCWVLTDKSGNPTNSSAEYHNAFTTNKKFQLSFIRSSKKELPGHKMRYEIAPLLEHTHSFELFFPKERIETKIPLFKDAMFHLTIENSQHANYITEKVIDCFMSYTIPIYWGCPNIGDYFDTNGMIIFNSKDELAAILENLSPELYQSKLNAVKHNYEVAKKHFAFFFDRINKVIDTL
jgi:hypothetical protein